MTTVESTNNEAINQQELDLKKAEFKENILSNEKTSTKQGKKKKSNSEEKETSNDVDDTMSKNASLNMTDLKLSSGKTHSKSRNRVNSKGEAGEIRRKKKSRDLSNYPQGKKEANNTLYSSKSKVENELAKDLDKEAEVLIKNYYGKDNEDLVEAKEILQNIKSGSRNAIPKEKLSLTIQNLNKMSKKPLASEVPIKKRVFPTIPKNETNFGPLSAGERLVKVNMIGLETLGEFKISKDTTFAELRMNVSSKVGMNNWYFQDYETKKSITEEKKTVLAPGNFVIVSNVNLEILMADATLHGSSTLGMNKDGSCSFRVLWWDSQYHKSRLVWLKFETARITVTGMGGSFKLFDISTLRVPLIFAGVKGSERAFQFMKSRYSTRASRFFATNVEQKKAIGIYFCFVWRPQAIRRGWIREQEKVIDDLSEEDDPRKFANILRRHMIEVDCIIRDIEKNMDYRTVRKYIRLFAQMFTEGYSLKKEDLINGENDSMENIQERLLKWQDQAKRKNKKSKSKSDSSGRPSAGKMSSDDDENISNSLQYDEFRPSPFVNDISNMEEMTPIADNLDPSIPPVPILPPPSAMIQKPPICPVNFDGISVADIVGTIWGEMKNLKLRKQEAEQMERELKIIFGRDSRNIVQNIKNNNTQDEGILDTNRVKNIEVLLHIEEIKYFSIEELIELVQSFDPIIFNFNVLERLTRPINTSDGKVMSFLPSKKEVELLNEYQKKFDKNPNLCPMRLGEKVLYLLSKNIPDRDYRFNFGFTIEKYEKESQDVDGLVDCVLEAEKAVRNADRFREALRLVLEILNTLMPRYGFTRGFKISTFCSSVERVKGSVNNPCVDNESLTVSSSSASVSESVQSPKESAEKKTNSIGAKAKNVIEMLKNRNVAKNEIEFWTIKLPEYMVMYLSKFESCQGFWDDLIEVCESASNVDQVYLDTQSNSWCSDLDTIKEWYSNITEKNENDPFYQRIEEFLQKEPEIRKVRENVLSCRDATEQLWRWLGERMESEPHLIYKYIENFCQLFKTSWALLQNEWKCPRTLILRGIYPMTPCKKKLKTNRDKDETKDSNDSEKLQTVKKKLSFNSESSQNEKVENNLEQETDIEKSIGDDLLTSVIPEEKQQVHYEMQDSQADNDSDNSMNARRLDPPSE